MIHFQYIISLIIRDFTLNYELSTFSQVKKYKIAKATVSKWFSELPIEQIKLGIDYVLNEFKAGKQIKNIGGYINQMVRTQSLVEVAQKQKTKQERIRIQQQMKQNWEKNINEQVEELQKKAHEMRMESLVELMNNPDINRQVIEK